MADDTRPLRAAIYARVSTAEQVEGTSLSTQLERCRLHIASQGWELVGSFVDEGVSGSKASRPQLDLLMAAAESGAIDAVVVMKLDRFGRSNRNLEEQLGRLDDHGVRFVSLSEFIDSTTPSGRLLRTMLGGVAEFERATIVERGTAGMEAAARAGKWLGGPPPFGRRYSDGQLELDPLETRVVRTAVEMIVDQGMSTWETAAALNALGLTPRNAPRWDHMNLRRVLSARNLSGTWTWGRRGTRGRAKTPIEIPIPAVISAERHVQLRSALAATTTGPRAVAKTYPLSGRLVALCGGTFHGVYRRDRDLRQYRCTNRRYEIEHRCDCPRLNADGIEQQVWTEISALLLDPVRLVRMIEDYLTLGPLDVDLEVDRSIEIDQQIERVEQALATAAGTGLKAGLDAAALRLTTQDLTSELAQLRRDQALARAWLADSARRSAQVRNIRDLTVHAHDRLQAMGVEERKEVFTLLDVRVVIIEHLQRGRASVRVEGTLPFRDLAAHIGTGKTAELNDDGAFAALETPFRLDTATESAGA